MTQKVSQLKYHFFLRDLIMAAMAALTKEDGKLDIDGLMDKDGCPDGMLVGQMDTL